MPAAALPPDRRQWQAFALLGLVMLLWAGNSIVARAFRLDIPPFTLALGRWVIAAAIILPFAWGQLRRDRAALMRSWLVVLLLGLLGIGAFNALLYTGLQHSTATNALLLQALTPALVTVLDRVLFGTRTTLLRVLGIAASIAGVATIVFRGDLAAAMRLALGRADLFLLGSALVWTFYTLLLRLKPLVAGTSLVAVTFVIGIIAMAPLAAWENRQGLVVNWSGGAVAAFLYVGILPSLVSYLIYNWAAEVVGPARATQTLTLMPLFGAFLSAGLLGEALHPYHFAGMAAIVAGIALSALGSRQSAAGAGSPAPLEDRA
ncbi:DMT family transporter [Croceibacterium ferulae]|uniref:DMT family transporter n=1 Tax=Croceibacterium ferulae TaxID=1854641 RepID=UPI000EAD5526|nr:DMT family transporter [Croceibacterium ferulae]